MLRYLVVGLGLVALSVQSEVAVAESEPAAPIDGQHLASYFGKSKNYKAVKRDVLRWHKTTRNGCVAFASTALRHLGVAIPERGKRDGWGVSRITFAFSDHLTEELDWVRIDDAAALKPGDLVFTQGAPDHVFVFHSYKDKRKLIARAIDNQGRKTARPLKPSKTSAVSAFAYALRSPADSSAD